MIEIAAITIDDDHLKEAIAKSADLEHEQAFAALADITKAKKELADALETLEGVEREVKYTIDDRAKALYGTDWQAIAGDGYKITRSKTGAVYVINPEVKPAKKFLKITETVNAKAIEAELEAHDGKLPRGIEYNPSRGTMIRITLK